MVHTSQYDCVLMLLHFIFMLSTRLSVSLPPIYLSAWWVLICQSFLPAYLPIYLTVFLLPASLAVEHSAYRFVCFLHALCLLAASLPLHMSVTCVHAV
jgi:general stress protein CsbA